MQTLPSLRFLESRIQRADMYLRDRDIVGASALAGAVLEATLRRLAGQHQINKPMVRHCPECGKAIGGEFTLGALIESLAARRVFNERAVSTLRRCTRIRNTAAHGHFGVITGEECRSLIEATKSLVSFMSSQGRVPERTSP